MPQFFPGEIVFLIEQWTKENNVNFAQTTFYPATQDFKDAFSSILNKQTLDDQTKKTISIIYIDDNERMAVDGRPEERASAIANITEQQRVLDKFIILCLTASQDECRNGYSFYPSRHLDQGQVLNAVKMIWPAFNPLHMTSLAGSWDDAHDTNIQLMLNLIQQYSQTSAYTETTPFKADEADRILAENFYAKESEAMAFSRSRNFFLMMLTGFMIFSAARYAESYMAMSQDQQTLEASALALQVMRVAILLSVRPLEAITMLGAALYGSKSYEKLGSLLRAGWTAALVSAAIFIPILYTANYWLYHVFGQDEQLSNKAGDFLKIYAWSMVPLTLSVANNNLFFATDQPGVVTLIELVAILIGVAVTYILVYDKMHIGLKGLDGLAYSLVIQKFLIFFLTAGYLYHTRSKRSYRLLGWPSCHEISGNLRFIFIQGAPFALQIGSEQLSLFVWDIYAGRMGNQYLATVNILTEYYVLLVISVALVLHKTCMQRTGERMGKHLLLLEKGQKHHHLIKPNIETVELIMKANVKLGLTSLVIITILFTTCSQPFTDIYLHDGDDGVSNDMSMLFKFLVLCAIPDIAKNLLGGILNGYQDLTTPMLTSIFLSLGLGSLAGYDLSFRAGYGLRGTLGGTAIGFSAGFVALSIMTAMSHARLKKGDCAPNILSRCCSLFTMDRRENRRNLGLMRNANLDDEAERLLPPIANRSGSVNQTEGNRTHSGASYGSSGDSIT